MKGLDLTGGRFGRLTVQAEVGRYFHQKLWKCLCDCGTVTNVGTSSLRAGLTRSCGCYLRERSREVNRTHGLSKHPLYPTWNMMRARCYLPNTCGYENYGGRGITVCDRWRTSFAAFLTDMGTRPPGHSLDRINNDGNYEPGNCRWATRIEQRANMHRAADFAGAI